jgi:hypothetical protein
MIAGRTDPGNSGPSGEAEGNQENLISRRDPRNDDASASEPEPSIGDDGEEDTLDPEPNFRRHPTQGEVHRRPRFQEVGYL